MTRGLDLRRARALRGRTRLRLRTPRCLCSLDRAGMLRYDGSECESSGCLARDLRRRTAGRWRTPHGLRCLHDFERGEGSSTPLVASLWNYLRDLSAPAVSQESVTDSEQLLYPLRCFGSSSCAKSRGYSHATMKKDDKHVSCHLGWCVFFSRPASDGGDCDQLRDVAVSSEIVTPGAFSRSRASSWGGQGTVGVRLAE